MPDADLMKLPEEAASVRDWIAAGESETLEFKASTRLREEGTRTLCAFLNKRGGRVLYGVRNDRTVPGQEVEDSTLKRLSDTINRIEPPITAAIDKIELDNGKSIIAVSVPKGRSMPYLFQGKAYSRTGPTTSEMPREEADRLLLERLHATERWELEPTSASIDDLDVAELRQMVDESVREGRAQDPLSHGTEELLTGLGLIRDGQLTNAAVALFGRGDRLLPGYPQCLLKLARFDGTIMGEHLSEQRQLHGNVFELLRQAEGFLRRHLATRSELNPGEMLRRDSLEIPLLALREAVVNALAHREYEGAAGSVSVTIFDDRVEIPMSELFTLASLSAICIAFMSLYPGTPSLPMCSIDEASSSALEVALCACYDSPRKQDCFRRTSSSRRDQ